MAEKSINDFVKEVLEAFGEAEYSATNNVTGQVLETEGWKEPARMFEMSVEDYLRFGNLKAGYPPPSPEAFAVIMKLAQRFG